tara:strand:- start:227 stop:511 length:285 start_codon:yes stop_codon:yes gene_type:complete
MGTSSLRVYNSSAETLFEIRDDSYTNHFLANAGMVIHNPMGIHRPIGESSSTSSYTSGIDSFDDESVFFKAFMDKQMMFLIKEEVKIIRPLSLR